MPFCNLPILNRRIEMRDHIVMVVHHNCQRLTQYYRRPYDNVTPTWTETRLHKPWQIREWQLSHHSHERPNFECFQRNAYLFDSEGLVYRANWIIGLYSTHQIFVEECTDEEDNYRCGSFVVAHFNNGNVKMTNAPPECTEQRKFALVTIKLSGLKSKDQKILPVNRHIPRSPKRIDVVRVPPIAIEIPIGKL